MKTILTIALIITSLLFAFAQNSGDLDLSFNGTGIVQDSSVLGITSKSIKVKQLANNQILVLGERKGVGILPLNKGNNATIIRLNVDGSSDLTFGNNGSVVIDHSYSDAFNNWQRSDEEAMGFEVMPNANILVLCNSVINGDDHVSLTMLKSNGEVDTTWGYDGKFFYPSSTKFQALSIQSNAKILIAGHTSTGGDQMTVARINANGLTFDSSFNLSGLRKIVIEPTSGAISVSNIIIRNNGNIVAVGRTGSGKGFTYELLPNGNDHPTRWSLSNSISINDLATYYDAFEIDSVQIAFCGASGINQITTGSAPIGRIRANGKTGFYPNNYDIQKYYAMDNNASKIIVAGSVTDFNDKMILFKSVKYDFSGQLKIERDSSFANNGDRLIDLNISPNIEEVINDVIYQNDGKVLGVGHIYNPSNQIYESVMVRLHTSQSVGVNNVSSINSFKVYPNPTNSALTLITNEPLIEVLIYDLKGLLVSKYSGETTINVSNLSSGLYHIVVLTKSNRYNSNFIKQ